MRGHFGTCVLTPDAEDKLPGERDTFLRQAVLVEAAEQLRTLSRYLAQTQH